MAGGAILAATTLLLQVALPDPPEGSGRWIFLVGAVCLVAADFTTIRHNGLYPLALRRQARQSLILRWRRVDAVLFTWGFDAGLSVGTYRVTSGLWVLLLAAVTIGASPGLIALSVISFAGALVAVSIWPSRGADPAERSERANERVLGLLAFRPLIQGVYAVLAVVAIALIAI